MADVKHPATEQVISVPDQRASDWLAAGWLAVAGPQTIEQPSLPFDGEPTPTRKKKEAS